MTRIPGFITVRSTSTRLPGKCFLPFGENCNVLQHIIRRAKYFDIEPIICTSVDPSDDTIEKIAIQESVHFYRGSLVNKLQRWADCASHFNIDIFHTVDADDPYFDGIEMHRSFNFLKQGGFDVVSPTDSSSAGAATVGYTLTRDVVLKACKGLDENADTEMMWYYLERLSDIKKTILPEINEFNLKVRLTLDYQEDYWLIESIRKIIGNFATRNEVDDLFLRNPDLYLINWFRNQEWKSSQEAKKI
jgi:spore coat polysaccharide biosynthesis protein SpsF (cytidylyltransferase family)